MWCACVCVCAFVCVREFPFECLHVLREMYVFCHAAEHSCRLQDSQDVYSPDFVYCSVVTDVGHELVP